VTLVASIRLVNNLSRSHSLVVVLVMVADWFELSDAGEVGAVSLVKDIGSSSKSLRSMSEPSRQSSKNPVGDSPSMCSPRCFDLVWTVLKFMYPSSLSRPPVGGGVRG
jgi:hypothetical protein